MRIPKGGSWRRTAFIVVTILVALVVTSCSSLRPGLKDVFGDRLGRIKQHPDYLAIEVFDELDEAEMYSAVLAVAESRTTATHDAIAVTFVLPDQRWRTESLIWESSGGTLEHWVGDSGEWEFKDGLAGAGTLVHTGTANQIGTLELSVYARGEATPDWETPASE